MVKQIVWTPQAKINRYNILEFYHSNGTPINALRKIDTRIREIILHLSKFPELGKHFGIFSERVIYKDNFAVIYKNENEKVLILHLWDTRRDPKTIPYG